MVPDAPGDAAGPAGPARTDRWLGLGQALLVAIPAVVVIAVVAGKAWGPSSDYAVMVMRTADVGGRHTPLLGVVSRNHGWYHPGPSQYYVMAPFQWAIGVSGTLVAAGLANLACLVIAVVAGHRRGGAVVAGLVAVTGLLLVRTVGPSFLVDPWNPWTPFIPLLAFVVLTWSVADRDVWCVPWAVGVGSYLVQAEVGYAPAALVLGGTAVVLLLVGQRRDLRRLVREAAWPLAVAALVGIAFWLGPVVQQLTGHPGNISALISYFRHPPTSSVGLHQGLRLWGEEFRVPGPWLTGHDTGFLGFVGYASPVEGLLLVAATLVLGAVAWRLDSPSAGRLAVLTSVASLAGINAIANITDAVASYLVRWAWVLAASLWLSILWSIWCIVVHSWQPAERRRPVVAGVITFGAAVLMLTLLPGARRARVPEAQASRAVSSLASQTRRSLDPRPHYLVRWTDGPLSGGVGSGVAALLTVHGYHVGIDRVAGPGMGQFRVLPAKDADAMVTIYDLSSAGPDWKPVPGSRLLARYNPISTSQLRELQQLDATIDAEVARRVGLTPADLATRAGATRLVANRAALQARGFDQALFGRAAALRALGSPYAVYVVPLTH